MKHKQSDLTKLILATLPVLVAAAVWKLVGVKVSALSLSMLTGISDGYGDFLYRKFAAPGTDIHAGFPGRLAAFALLALMWYGIRASVRGRRTCSPTVGTGEKSGHSGLRRKRSTPRPGVSPLGMLCTLLISLTRFHALLVSTYRDHAKTFVRKSTDRLGSDASRGELLRLKGEYSAVDNASHFLCIEGRLQRHAERKGVILPEFCSIPIGTFRAEQPDDTAVP